MTKPFDATDWKLGSEDTAATANPFATGWHSIRIVHFINPHCFYFKLADLTGRIERQIDQMLANALDLQPKDGQPGYEPKENEMVAAFIPTYSRWVRAQVDAIVGLKESKEYVVWCLDYGIPWRVSVKLIRPLPAKAAGQSGDLELVETTYVGGLSNCLPSKTQLAFDTMKTENVVSDDWCDAAVDATVKLINESGEIKFRPAAKYRGIIFGDVMIKSFTTHSNDLTQYLCSNQYAISDARPIPNDMHSVKTMLKMRYQNNKGQLNAQCAYFDIEMPRPSKGFKSVASAVSLDLTAIDKRILTWNERNEGCEAEEFNVIDAFLANIEQLEVVKQTSVESEKLHNYKYATRCNDLLASKASDAFGSQLTIASETSIASSVMSNHEKRVSAMNRALGRMKKNMAPIPENKQRIYCPAGYERDLQHFKKYNA